MVQEWISSASPIFRGFTPHLRDFRTALAVQERSVARQESSSGRAAGFIFLWSPERSGRIPAAVRGLFGSALMH